MKVPSSFCTTRWEKKINKYLKILRHTKKTNTDQSTTRIKWKTEIEKLVLNMGNPLFSLGHESHDKP